MKRIIILVVAVLMLMCLVGCGNDGAPSGMKLASDRSQVDYSLYIPEEWTIDQMDTFSRAHAENDISAISVFTFPISESQTIGDWWTSYYKPSIEKTLSDFEMLEGEIAGMVDGKASLSYTFKSTLTKTQGEESAILTYKNRITIVKNGACAYVLWYNGTVTEKADYYTQSLEAADKIVKEFRFSALESGESSEVTEDKNAPEGMKLASNKKIVLYSLYVPSEWVIKEQTAMTMAYVSEENKSSVSVMQWNLTEDSRTIEMWWENYHKKEVSESFDSFNLIEEGAEYKLDQRDARTYTYTVTIAGTTYKYFVVAAIDQGSIHVLTYTSTEALYEETLKVVREQILPNFKFD